MKLNNLEFLLMNNPIRAFVQEIHEVRILRAMSSIGNIERALEIGCGNGNGTKLIKKYFAPKFIDAVDLDDKMIAIAQKRNNDISINYQVMDVSLLNFPDKTFDVIFDFGIIHHVPNWKNCISEIKRVLKPDGEVIIEDLSTDTFSTFPGRIWKILLDHPYDKMFSTEQFVDCLKSEGFKIVDFQVFYPLLLFKHFSIVARNGNIL